MMTEEEFLKLAKLCRISCTPEEKTALLKSLTQVLGYVAELNTCDTGSLPTCNTVLENPRTIVRDDTPGDVLSRDLFLANAPAHTGGMVRVPPVLKGEQ